MSLDCKKWILLLVAFQLSFGLWVFAEDPDSSADTEQKTPAEYTRLKRFPQNLGGNFKALFSTHNIVPLVVGAGATGVVAPFDQDIRDDVGVMGGSTLGKVGSVLGGPAVVFPAVGGLLIWGHYSENNRFHSFTYSLAQGTVISEGLVEGLKFAVGRNRPDRSNNQSFPSGHAASTFMIASVIHHYYGWKAGILGYSVATFVGFCRIREDKHWASDVMAGATLGYIVGSSASRRTGISVKVGKAKATFTPSVDLTHRSLGVWISTGS